MFFGSPCIRVSPHPTSRLCPRFVSKATKSAGPHLAGHTLQFMPRRSPRASDPHTGHVPARFHGSPIQPLSSKNPDISFGKASVSGSANQAPIRSPQTPCADCRRGAACPDGAPARRNQRPVQQTSTSNRLADSLQQWGALAMRSALYRLHGHASTGLTSRPFTRAVSGSARKNRASQTRRDQRPVPQITHQYSHTDSLRLLAARRRHATTERKFVGSVGAGFLVRR